MAIASLPERNPALGFKPGSRDGGAEGRGSSEKTRAAIFIGSKRALEAARIRPQIPFAQRFLAR
jgi:hypothetical protein